MKSCKTCAFAILTLPFAAECDEDNAKSRNWSCPPEMVCDKWKEADAHTIEQNSHDWSKAKTVIVD